MRNLIKVDSDSSLFRDPVSNAILATDVNKLQRYKLKQNMIEARENKINLLNDRITDLENLITLLVNKNEKH